MLAEELAMMSLLMESVVVAFALGGVVGAVIAIHLLYRHKEVPSLSRNGDERSDEQTLVRQNVPVRVKIPPRG